MPVRMHAFIAAAYLALAVGTGLAVHLLAEMGPLVSGLTSSALLLGFALLHTTMLGARRLKGLKAEIEQAQADQLALADTLVEALAAQRAEMAKLAQSFEEDSEARSALIEAEVRVLETQIAQLSDGIATHSGRARPIIRRGAPRDKGTGRFDPAQLKKPQPVEDLETELSGTMLEEIRDALENNRVDLYLQPIVSLPQRKLRLYEGLTRLRSRSGALILPKHYLPTAERAGLISTIDNLLLFRSVQIVRRMAGRDRSIGLACNMSAHTLQDNEFFAQFLEFMGYNTDLARNLIFEFGQYAFEHAGPVEMANLRSLAEMGFRFSLDHVTSLDLDPRYLYERNFRYVKIHADVLLDPETRDTAPIHPSDLKEHLGRNGIDLIAERIEDERTVVEVLEYDIEYGQGYLFAEPMPLEEVEERGAITMAPQAPLLTARG